MPITLTKTETAILTDAAGREGGLLLLPDTMKPVTRERILGRFTREDLIVASEEEGSLVHRLLTAGYMAVGLTPPPAATGSKRDIVLGLIGQPDGASLAELVAATGWLPHSTRGALSRLRSGGLALTRFVRDDGMTAYRMVVETPKPAGRKRHVAAEPAAAEAAAA